VIGTSPDVQRIDGMILPGPLNVRLHVYRMVSDSNAVFPETSNDDVNCSIKLLHALYVSYRTCLRKRKNIIDFTFTRKQKVVYPDSHFTVTQYTYIFAIYLHA